MICPVDAVSTPPTQETAMHRTIAAALIALFAASSALTGEDSGSGWLSARTHGVAAALLAAAPVSAR
jgi:hypothetical protein